MRRDVHVNNESTGFVITSEGVAADRRPDDQDLGAPGSRGWKRAVDAGLLLPLELVQDDAFVVRVVVDEDLTEVEEDERVGRVEGRLALPDGRLALCGGTELLEEGLEWAHEYTQVLEVAPGTYRVTVDAHLPGVNGEHLLGRAMGRRDREELGAYFRRTRGKKKFPGWLQARCAASPVKDPGHEDAWADVEVSERAFVDFVVHLTKLGRKKVPAPKVGKDGWVGLGAWEVARPEACPLGLPAKRVLRPKAARVARRRPVELPDVEGLLAGRPLFPLEGGPLEVDVEALGRVFLLAWFATDASHPEVRLELPAPDAPFAVEVDGVTALRDGALLRLGAPRSTLKWEALERARAMGRALARAPEGSVLELLSACPDLGVPGATPEGEEGRQRYRGPLRGGRWRLEATHPPLEADVLREALALAAHAETGRSLELRDEDEARDVHARAMKEDGFLFEDNPLEVAGATLRLRQPHAQHLTMVAQHAFRARYAEVWAVPPEREGLGDFFAALDREVADLLGAPTDDEVVFEGAFSPWTRADVLAVPGVDPARVEETHRGMAALGFAHLGDMVCRRAGDVALRGYALPGGHTWGVLMVGTLGQGGLDLVTEFEGGGMVTTTTTPGQTDDPGRDVFRESHPPATTPLALLFAHRKRVAAHEPRLGPTRTVEPTLRALAVAMDAALARESQG